MKYETIYVVFRVYGPKERQSRDLVSLNPFGRDNGAHFYGWTPSKATVKAFLEQRSKHKYVVQEVDRDELFSTHGDRPSDDLLIDMIQLRSNKLGTDVVFFTTPEEKEGIEKRIQKLFRELSSLDSIWQEDLTKSPVSDFVNAIVNLLPGYANALHYIGYRPDVIDMVYDSVQDHDADDDLFELPTSPSNQRNEWTVDDPCKVIIYSLESVIKVIRDEL